MEIASRQNLDLAAARLERSVSLAGIQIARQIPNPSVSFGALRDAPHESLFFDQPLEIGGRRGRRIELARQEAGLTETDITAVARRVRRDVRVAYYGVVLAQSLIEQQEKALALAERLRGIAQTRFEAGDVAQLEVLQAELEVARAKSRVQVAQQGEKVAFSQLNALLNEPADASWKPEGSLEAALPQLTMKDLEGRAVLSNAELQRLMQRQKVEDSRQSLFRAERIPNVTLELGTDFNAPPDFRVGPRGQISVEVPLFSRNQGELAQSKANVRALEGQSAALRRAVEGRVQTAFYALQTEQTQVDLYRQTLLPSGRQLAAMAEESYRAGKADILTVLDAQRNVQQLETEYLQNLFALQESFAQLEQTVGGALD